MRKHLTNSLRILYNLEQIPLVALSYLLIKLFVPVRKCKWIVGAREIVNNIADVSKSLPNSYSVHIGTRSHMSYQYDLRVYHPKFYFLHKLFVHPVVFGFCLVKGSHFFLVADKSFLVSRKLEYQILKLFKKKVVVWLTGSDIRSPQKSSEVAKELGRECYMDFLGLLASTPDSRQYESEKRHFAACTDRYADLIFNLPKEQASYLTSEVERPFYVFPRVPELEHLDCSGTIKIVHAPSAPITKGTQLVRAAIQKLKHENYNIEYVELQNMHNDVVLEHLRTTHILLNEYYALVPGTLGIEGMAYKCAVVQSADPTIEPFYPFTEIAFDKQWMVTLDWQVYDHIKYLLDNPEEIKVYAESGYQMVKKYCSRETTTAYFNAVLSKYNLG